MGAFKYKIDLNEDERNYLTKLSRGGETSARKVKLALVLLRAEQGLSDREIAEGLMIGDSTSWRVRTRFVTEGLESSLSERPRPGQKRKLSGAQEAHLVAIACSDPPPGHTYWKPRLLAAKAVGLGYAESISSETVRQMLKRTTSGRGTRRNGASRT